MSEWSKVPVSEIATPVIGGTPRRGVPEYWNGDISWAAAKDIASVPGRYLERVQECITKQGLESSAAKLMPAGTVVITARGTVGALAQLRMKMAFNQTCYALLPRDGLDSNFLFYALKGTLAEMQALTYGTVFETITKRTFDNWLISLPPLPEQKAIASVLSSLDDKIDLLNRQNKTLEAMAETLFRQWFVEEAQEMNYGKIGDFVSVIDNRGKTPPYIENPTIYPIIEVNALIGENRLVDYSVIKKYVVQETYDSWFRGHPKKYDTIISTVGSIGETAMFLIEKGTIAQNVIALSPINISPFYLYQFVKSSKNEIKELDIGSVQPSIKVPHLLSVDIPIPNSKQLIEFDNQMKLFLNKMSLNYSKIRTLEKLRDTLLPKLMSGKVSVEYEQERDY